MTGRLQTELNLFSGPLLNLTRQERFRVSDSFHFLSEPLKGAATRLSQSRQG